MTDEERAPDPATVEDAAPPSAPTRELPGGRQLVRSRQDRMVAGVAGGLGAHFGIDPIVFRLGFGVLTLFAGAGLALYLAAWALIPDEGSQEALADRWLARAKGADEDRSPWIWAVLLLCACFLVLASLDSVGWTGSWFWAILLIAGGIWLYQRDVAGRADGSDPPAPAPDGPTPPAPAMPSEPAPAPPAAVPASPPGRSPSSRLGWNTLAVALLVVGGAALLDSEGVLDVSAGEYLALALTVTGAGLLVGAWWGRSRMLIAAGLLLIPILLVLGSDNLHLGGGIGERVIRPATSETLGSDHRLFAGKMLFDLSRTAWGPEPVELRASVLFGEIEVVVPSGVQVDLRGQARLGRLGLFGDEQEGGRLEMVRSAGPRGGPRLILDAHVLFGHVDVTRSDLQYREAP